MLSGAASQVVEFSQAGNDSQPDPYSPSVMPAFLEQAPITGAGEQSR
jgi:hypothetical protein